MQRTAICLMLVLGASVSLDAQTPASLQIRKTAALVSVTGKFDHFAYDGAGQRLFIAATGNHSVEVLNVESGAVVEEITGLGKPHGLAWVADEKKLFVADGTLADLRVYSGSPFKLIADIPLSDDADDMVYDEITKLLYVGHGGGSAAIPGRVAVIDTHENSLIANLPSSAHPEALDIDPNGRRVFANIAGSGEVLVIDATSHTIAQTWKLSRAKDNVPVAYDPDHHVLLIGCRTPGTALSLDAITGRELSSQPSASGADDLFYESASHRAYLISGSGTVDVYEVLKDKTLKALAAIKTESGAKTGLLVPSLHTLFVGIPSAAGRPAEIRMYSTSGIK